MAAKRRVSKIVARRRHGEKRPAGTAAAGVPAVAGVSRGFPIVGIGASAGGLDAFREFFAHMPTISGMAFVVVSHLDPEHSSELRGLLSEYTNMPVVDAVDGLRIRPNHVYVIPPNAELRIRNGRLRVARPSRPRGRRMPIDVFFAALAADQQENAVSVILSGTGSDGSLGTVAIKEHGGITFAQHGGAVKFDGMPRHAQETGLIDFALPVEQMPRQLIDCMSHMSRLDRARGLDRLREDVARLRQKICLLLRNKTGHDFSDYKENTFIRRVLRRMQILRVDSAARFLERLRRDPSQIDLLFQELLIGVTQFFRDPKVWEALDAKVIPEILRSHPSASPLRVWVPGCASGEEAYTIAMLFREHIAKRAANIRVQIFATDIDIQALDAARAGWYPDGIAASIAPSRLERFFTRERGGYRINKEIRELCIFSAHNVIKDPPFSRLDLISCRNLLIYLNGDLQQRVVPLFHFALNPGGFLVLGLSENAGDHGKLFTRLESKAHIFRRRSAVAARLPDLPFVHAPKVGRIGAAAARRQFDDEIGRSADRQIERRRPAYVVVDENADIIRFSGPTGRYIQHASGTASLNLFGLVDKSIRSEVRALVEKAIAERRRIEHEPVPLRTPEGRLNVSIVVEPLADAGVAEPLWIVSFQPVGPSRREARTRQRSAKRGTKRTERIEALESELMNTRERLQNTIEELETSNEELKSSNEELHSLNEELQSANEELETSKEELQSVNEELETVNSELSSKLESFDRANSDLKNLLESTQIATVFLGDDLRIKSFTPAITDVFNLIERDIGRPITDITGHIDYDLVPDVRRVQRTLDRVEREVKGAGGSAYIMRILPYRTVGNVIDGVVITFVDITERKRAEEERALLATIVRNSPDAIVVIDGTGRVLAWNHGAEQMYGHTAAQMIGQQFSVIVPEEFAQQWRERFREAQEGEAGATFETERLRRDGGRARVSVKLAAVRDAKGKATVISSVERAVGEAWPP